MCQFLKDIENDFKYTRFFHSQQKIILAEQYIPIHVTLQRKYRREVEASREYVESEEGFKSAYAIKGMDAESQKGQVSWEEAKEQHQRIMVLADPGMGKSILLKMEAGSTAQRERQQLSDNRKNIDDVIIPIFLKFSDLYATEKEIFDALLMIIRRNYPKTSEEITHLLEEQLNRGKCLLLLDALDEVPKDHRNSLSEKLNRFARDYPCSIICTSRIVGYSGAFLDDAREVEIVPFNRKQIKQYVQNWFANAVSSINNDSASADGFLRELRNKPQIQGPAQIPLLLSLLCSLYQERDLALPTRRCEIYEKAVEYMLSRWSQNRNPQSKERIRAKVRLLEELAYHFTCKGVEIFPSDDLYDRIEEHLQGERTSVDLRNPTTSELITELSEKDRIIELERNGESYTFLHWNFQEYLAASYLNRAKNGMDLARGRFWEYDWHGILTLLAGLMKDPVPLLQAITDEKDDIFSSMLLLAGRCVAECEECSHPLITEIIDRICKLWRSYPSVDFVSSVAWVLGRANSQMSERLRRALNDEHSEIREAAAKALAEIGSQQVVEPLIQAFKDEDSDIGWKAAEALAEIGGQQVVDSLIHTLKDKDGDVRRYSAWTLGRIGDRQVVQPLIQILNDEDSSVRYYAAWALGEIGGEQAVEPLIQTLEGEDSNVRGAAARALSEIGSDQAIESLIQALKNENSDVRWAAAEVLGKISSDQAIEPLIQILNDEDSDVRETAVEALGKISSDQAIEPLVQALEGEDSDIGGTAARALGKIGSERAVEPLIRALENENSDVREAAVEALSKVGGKQAIEPLIQTLNDEDSFVRGMAAEALGRVGSEQAIEPLIQTLSDEYSDVRWAATTALGEIGSQQAIEPLIKAFKDEYGDVRGAAAMALGKIGTQQVVNALIQALDDEDLFVRRGAAEALGETGSKQAVEPLIQTLNHRDSKVRGIAAAALGKIGSKQAAESLTYVIEHKRRYIREATARVLDEVDSQQAVDALIQSLSDQYSDARWAGTRVIGEIDSQQAVEPLVRALNDEDSYVRREVTEALCKIGGQHGVEPLIQVLNDEDSYIRWRAAEALMRIGTLGTLEKILRSPIIDVYNSHIFPLARMLAVRFSKEKTPFIPIYPESTRGISKELNNY